MDKSFIFAILTALVWGLAPAFEKAGLSGRIDPFMGVVLRTIPIAAISITAFLLMGRGADISRVDLKSAAFVMAGGLLAGLAGQFLFYSALKHGEASVVVPLAAIYPLFALAISVLFLGEAFTWQKLAGIGFVVAGVVLLR